MKIDEKWIKCSEMEPIINSLACRCPAIVGGERYKGEVGGCPFFSKDDICYKKYFLMGFEYAHSKYSKMSW